MPLFATRTVWIGLPLVAAGAIFALPRTAMRAGDGPSRSSEKDPTADIVVESEDQPERTDAAVAWSGTRAPAVFGADAMENVAFYPGLEGKDLSTVLTGDRGRAAVFSRYSAEATGGTIVFVEGYQIEDGRHVLTTLVQKRVKLGGDRVDFSEVRRLEKWGLNPDGSFSFLRESPSRGGFYPGMFRF